MPSMKACPDPKYATKSSPGAKKAASTKKSTATKGAAKQMAPFLKKSIGRF